MSQRYAASKQTRGCECVCAFGTFGLHGEDGIWKLQRERMSSAESKPRFSADGSNRAALIVARPSHFYLARFRSKDSRLETAIGIIFT